MAGLGSEDKENYDYQQKRERRASVAMRSSLPTPLTRACRPLSPTRHSFNFIRLCLSFLPQPTPWVVYT